jgi:hypothetical protein
MSDVELVDVEQIPDNSITDITIILDRSGSMQSIAGDTIGGYNAFISDQRKQQGTTKITLVQFDNEYEVVFDAQSVSDVADLDDQTFVPRGSTALLDAIGRRINETRARINALDDADKPETVMLVIITDGFENASREFTSSQVKALIEECEDELGWDIVYLGANQDAWSVAGTLGIKGGKALSYAYSGDGATRAFESVSLNTNTLRSAKAGTRGLVGSLDREEFGFTQDDITAQAELDPTIEKKGDS